MSIGLSSNCSATELEALAAQLDRLYDTVLTNALVEMVREIGDELRERRRCQYCQNQTTRWLCDKSHIDN